MTSVREPPQAMPNFRDLGGLSTVDGSRVRPRRLMRAAALCAVAAPVAEALTARTGPGIYLDLRTPREIERDGAPVALLDAGWAWHRAPVQDKAPGDRADDAQACLRRYRATLPRYLTVAAQAAELLAEGPVVVACSLGKDRTGMVIALLLRWVGVHRDDILADFERSNAVLAAERRNLPPRWRDPAVPINAVPGRVCAAVLDSLEHSGRAGGDPPAALRAALTVRSIDDPVRP
jgi:protein-tyrosine phosphatase